MQNNSRNPVDAVPKFERRDDGRRALVGRSRRQDVPAQHRPGAVQAQEEALQGEAPESEAVQGQRALPVRAHVGDQPHGQAPRVHTPPVLTLLFADKRTDPCDNTGYAAARRLQSLFQDQSG